MTRILHVTEDHSLKNTGITNSLDAILRQIPGNIRQDIVCTDPETVPIPEGNLAHILPAYGPGNIWRMARCQRARLGELVSQAEVIHLHGIWMWIQWAAAQEAIRFSKPFLLTVHGMLEPWIWSRQSLPHRFKKIIYWQSLAYPAFKQARLIHALTRKEAENLKTFFPGKRIEIIPNGLNLAEIDQIFIQRDDRQLAESPYFLFMGRLHPVKAIHLLIEAFSRLTRKNFVLKIAGPTEAREKQYADRLKHLVIQAGLEKRVQFLGMVQGAQKWCLYRKAWAFCLPSFSEVIGIANLEAAACATPVITTVESGIIEDWANNGGILIHPEVNDILAGLEQAASWSQAERDERGGCLRKLVERYYSWQVTSHQWIALYQELGRG